MNYSPSFVGGLYLKVIERSGVMIRGTTAGFKFTLPYPLGRLAEIQVTFWQEGYKGSEYARLPIVKKFEDFDPSDESTQFTATLTALETKRFTDKLKARMQLVARTRAIVDSEGKEIEPSVRFASRETLITVYPINDDIKDDNPEDIAPTDDDGWVILDGQVIAN
jgi:hypothetical protein